MLIRAQFSLFGPAESTIGDGLKICSPTQYFFCRYSDRNYHGNNSFCQNITITEADTVASPPILITAMQYIYIYIYTIVVTVL